MSPESDRRESDEMRPEYDFRGGVRGKYYKEYLKGTNVVLLEPDVAAVFHDSESVNQALRVLKRQRARFSLRRRKGRPELIDAHQVSATAGR
jgi:hypothetical protein